MIRKGALIACGAGVGLIANAPAPKAEDAPVCAVEIVVLGAGQDAGAPQIGSRQVGGGADTGPRLLPASLGVIDYAAGQRFVFDASPAITDQVAMLDAIAPAWQGLGIDGIFITHAHIGHYLGLAYLGFEAANADNVPVYTLPRMAEFLRGNAPWNQLLSFGNIAITEMSDGALVQVNEGFGVSPITVPHRDELSETAGYAIVTLPDAALYVPDLDSWDEWEEQSGETLEALIENVDYAFIDATFWDDNELLDANGNGRDMSAIPHPRVLATMERLAHLPVSERAKVHFIHYNHTNPIRDPASAESREVADRGFNVARRGDRHCLTYGQRDEEGRITQDINWRTRPGSP